ncbi:MAG: hypothetical protein ACXVCY_03455 [Pseudobdellovibrionaceae bacterium]
MEKFILRSLLAISLYTITACSGGVPDNISGIDPSAVVSGSFANNDHLVLSGTGTIRFTEILSLFSSRSIALTASLNDAFSPSFLNVNFYSNFAVLPVNDGIMVAFSRSGAGVNVFISYNGSSAAVTSSKLTYYFPTSLDVIIEVHDNSSQARVLIWRRNFVEYTAATADIDTTRPGDLGSPLPMQRGGGPYVGLSIQNATVTAAHLGPAKVLN